MQIEPLLHSRLVKILTPWYLQLIAYARQRSSRRDRTHLPLCSRMRPANGQRKMQSPGSYAERVSPMILRRTSLESLPDTELNRQEPARVICETDGVGASKGEVVGTLACQPEGSSRDRASRFRSHASPGPRGAIDRRKVRALYCWCCRKGDRRLRILTIAAHIRLEPYASLDVLSPSARRRRGLCSRSQQSGSLPWILWWSPLRSPSCGTSPASADRQAADPRFWAVAVLHDRSR